jgi:hypothetical protein
MDTMKYFKIFLTTIAFAAFVIGTSPFAAATPIFTNFGAGQSYDTSGGNPIGNAFDGNTYAEGDTFVSGGNFNLGSITLALSYVFPGSVPDNFTVALKTDSGNAPGSTVLESWTVLGIALGPLGTNHLPLTLTSVLNPALTNGTRYWVTGSSDSNDSIAWNWNSTGDSSDEAISLDGGSSWFSPSGLTSGALEVDSRVIVPTPEPSTIVLLCTGLLTLVALRGRFN